MALSRSVLVVYLFMISFAFSVGKVNAQYCSGIFHTFNLNGPCNAASDWYANGCKGDTITYSTNCFLDTTNTQCWAQYPYSYEGCIGYSSSSGMQCANVTIPGKQEVCGIPSGGGDCLSTAPACGGTCPSGTYCRAKVSDPSQCVCAESTGDGCNGGYVYECKTAVNCRGAWGPGGSLSCPSGEISCRGCCVAGYPSSPTLISPANGAVLNQSLVDLRYENPLDWGNYCENLNPTITLKLGVNPSSLSVVERYQAPAATSVALVGSNVEIGGFAFPRQGTSVSATLRYQSAVRVVAGAPKAVTQGYALCPSCSELASTSYRWMTAEQIENIDEHGWTWGGSYCQSTVGLDGWNKDTSRAWLNVNGGGVGSLYYRRNSVCGSWVSWGSPSVVVRYSDGQLMYNGEYCERSAGCYLPNPTLYPSTLHYTAERSYSGSYQVGSDRKVRIPTADLPAGGISGNLSMNASISMPNNGFSYNLSPGQYYWQVCADNGAAVIGGGSGTLETCSPIWNFTVNSGVSGTVYYDPAGTCSTGTPSGLTGGMVMRYSSSGVNYDVAIASTGTNVGQFSILAPGGSGTLALTNIPSGFTCSAGCGVGCPTASGVVSPTQGNNFFLTDIRNPWWQAQGAGIYAGSSLGGTTIRSLIPSSVPEGSRYLILPGAGANGALLRASGTTSLLNGAVSTNNWSARTSYKGKKIDYTYLAPRIGVTLRQPNDWGTNTLNQPGYQAEKEYYYHKPTGAASIDNAWSVSSGEKYIVLVDGDLNINRNIAVATGGFLTFIVKGSVTVAPTVTRVDGLLLMDNNLVTQTAGSSNDAQLVFNGSVVAWRGVSLLRDMGVGNNSAPAELFNYRQDLIANMPNILKVYAMEWREVPAGTFGD